MAELVRGQGLDNRQPLILVAVRNISAFSAAVATIGSLTYGRAHNNHGSKTLVDQITRVPWKVWLAVFVASVAIGLTASLWLWYLEEDRSRTEVRKQIGKAVLAVLLAIVFFFAFPYFYRHYAP